MFSQLLDRGCFCDVTLACEGQIIRAHRVVLCACSTYFDTMLTNYSAEKDTIIIMKDAKFSDVKYLIEFMYKGEINVEHESLASLLKTAEELKIKGLAEVSWREDDMELPASDMKQTFQETTEPPVHQEENSLPRMPLLTPIPSPTQEPPIIGPKRKRGRPPLDEEYDVYSTPQISRVESVAIPPPAEVPSEPDPVPIAAEEPPEEPSPIKQNFVLKEDIDVPMESENEIDQDDDESTDDQGCSSNFLLTPQEQEEWKDVVKMDAYLAKGRRPQFWEEAFTKRVMEAIKTKELEMKKAAQLLGVSYGTLYGRYRETYGCLKHPYRGSSTISQYRDVWPDKGATGLIDSKFRLGSGLDGLWLR